MLVLSRTRQESVVVNGPSGGCLVTVLQLRGDEASVLISHTAATRPGLLDAWTARLVRGATVRVGDTADVTLVDVHGERARIGINASKESSVHRLEVWEVIRGTKHGATGGEEDGPAGSRVPRPPGPKPPSLDVRLDEPPPPDDE